MKLRFDRSKSTTKGEAMNKQRSFLRLGLAFAVAMTAGAECASAATYVESLFAPVQAIVSSEAHGIDASGVIVGFAMTSKFTTYAVKW